MRWWGPAALRLRRTCDCFIAHTISLLLRISNHVASPAQHSVPPQLKTHHVERHMHARFCLHLCCAACAAGKARQPQSTMKACLARQLMQGRLRARRSIDVQQFKNLPPTEHPWYPTRRMHAQFCLHVSQCRSAACQNRLQHAICSPPASANCSAGTIMKQNTSPRILQAQ